MHFSNGSEGMDFEAQWCARCVNNRVREHVPEDEAGEGCAVYGAHFLYQQETNPNDESDVGRQILDFLIDESLDPPCRLFLLHPDSAK